MGNSDFKNRFIEIHGSSMWNGFHVRRAIRFAMAHQLTGIIFHCNDLIDKVVKPEKYFEKREAMQFYKNREGDVKNHQYYFQSILSEIKAAGLEFYAEVKELECPREILEKYPFLRDDRGVICPTNPFWWEYLEEKVREFITRFPEVGGIIVSPGTRESLVSFSGNKCTCRRCRSYDIHQWYRELIASMHRPLSAAGKKLIVRDFAYTPDHQTAMVEAAQLVSDDIVMALKMAPHDFYPTFPDNPTVGQCGKLEQWIEFDVWGQFFGLGVFPCSIAEDMQGRMQRYLKKGATGIILRTDWERLLQGSAFNSFSMCNLIAGAMLSRDVWKPLDEVYEAWVREGLLSPLLYDSEDQKPCVPTGDHAVEALKAFMKRSWEILEKTIYVRGHVFNRNTQTFDLYYMTYYIMTVHHSREAWDPGASQKVLPTDENIRIMFQEKDEAVRMAEELPEYIDPERLGVNATIKEYLEFLMKAYVLFTKSMRLECRAAVRTRRALESGEEADRSAAYAELDGADELADALNGLVRDKGYANSVLYVLDGERVRRFKEDIERELKMASKFIS